MTEVLINKENSTIILTLNRERVLNALNLNMVRIIAENISSWNDDDSISGVLLRGEGEKAFCAGGDIVSVYHSKNDEGNNLSHDFFKEEYLLNYEISKFKKPWISLLNGIAMGGGLGLSVHGSHRIVSEKTVTAMPETAIGLFPDVGGGYFLSRIENHLGHYLAITGSTMNSADTLFTGIGTNYIDSKSINKLLYEIKKLDNYDNSMIDKILLEMATSDGNQNEIQNHIDKINKHFSYSTVNEIIKSLENSNEVWEKNVLKTLKKKSPTSMAVTQKQLIKSKGLDFDDNLKMEFRICQAMMKKHDFYEGVRANLVEKDRNPKWNPATIDLVTDEIIDSHFLNLNEKELF